MAKQYELTVAPNGAHKTKTDHPALPISAEEIATTAAACQSAGAGAIHLHVRDNQGQHSLDAGRYREAIAAISERAPGMAIQITTESAGLFDVATQYACLADLQPAASSVSVREMARDVGVAERLYGLADELGTRVQHILYGPDCARQLMAWRHSGLVRPAQDDVIFVLGQYVPEILGQPQDINRFLELLDGQHLSWTVCAFGVQEQACLLRAIQLGGNARIGFENSLLASDGAVLQDNAQSVASLVHSAGQLEFYPLGKAGSKAA